MIWAEIWGSRVQVLVGLEGTIRISIIALVTSTLFGGLVGILNARGPKLLKRFLRIYIEICRGSPLLVQLLLVYFGSAYLGFDGVTALAAVIVTLTLYEGAYISEIVRSGLEAVPKGQEEAARSVGLNAFQRLRYVLLPQAVRIIMPALVGQWISLVKDSALSSIIGYSDLIQQGQAIYARLGHPFAVLSVIGAAYFLICSPLTMLARRLERRRVRT
ncbi:MULTISPECIES: amino acid ABC transporter permease [unclassified Mesorhizobium]|uniref:amino acid ABC transporter permease n=1 Tax=unclassified Mesorhizobium TaxID=325217 RepID=UPI000FD920BC|nr:MULTISPECIES: amino acid ABC transporter permease [unclassified Mesorhizobium]TGT71891.1 amino acid ABC transporter permease [Mesorhizobium sp. M2E.F.Ca.ET.166.01.1.1]TGV99394.1 amino acid ABC transporter permease [Mesorhizobium sp. M2E.F.Ca.ET.154.01.1.1]